jgi:hypothetical protein
LVFEARDRTTTSEHSADPPDAARAAPLTHWLDGVSDLFVLLFALWTLIYHLGLLVRPPTAVLLTAWVVAGAALGALYVRRRTAARGDQGGSGRGCKDQADTGRVPAEPAGRGSATALIAAAGFALASLFIINPDADDAYFVSRSVWTAEHGRIPFRDVIFTQGSSGPIAGEPPVSSIEVLIGALARVLGLHASSLLWYVYLPAVTFLSVWAMWRLTRLWASRRAVACFLTGAVYLLWTGASGASLGSFHLLRIWQGKAAFVALLVPLLYVHLTRWAEHRSRGALCLAVASGVAATGLTSSAAFLVPLVTAAVVLPLLVTRQVRAALPAAAAMAYPLAAGLAVTLLSRNVEVHGRFHTGTTSYSMVLLTGALGLLAGCALWISPWAARRGAPMLITLGIAGLATLLVVPGVLELLRDATGAGPVLWRTMWIVPAPVLIGLLAALPSPDRIRWLAPLPALAVCTTAVVAGTPVWAAANGSEVTGRPRWKADPGRLYTARLVIAANRGGGVVLMPPSFMRNVPLLTSRTNSVKPNDHYLRMLPASQAFIDDRLLLSGLATPRGPLPAVAQVRTALERAGVTIACVRPPNREGLKVLRAAGYRAPTRIGQLVCVFPPA